MPIDCEDIEVIQNKIDELHEEIYQLEKNLEVKKIALNHFKALEWNFIKSFNYLQGEQKT